MAGVLANSSSGVKGGTAPAKRSLFNKPSWSKPQALVDETGLFHRSNQTYVDITTEAERQRRKKQARKDRERVTQADHEERPGKRQCLSESEDDEDDDSHSNQSLHQSGRENTRYQEEESQSATAPPPASLTKSERSPKSLLKRYEANLAAKQSTVISKPPTSKSPVIDLEDEEEEPQLDGGSEPVRPSVTPGGASGEDEPASDDEFPELARQARERARRKRLEEIFASTRADPLPTSQDGPFERSQSSIRPTPPPPPPDPVIQILITSSIPDTEPLIVNRRISQRLKDVKLAWVERQRFSSDLAAKVFLVWRQKRLFDVTSCKSLGIIAGPDGGVLVNGEYVGDDEGRLYMEAMTPDLFEACKRLKVQEAPTEEESHENDVVGTEQKETQVRIICKAKGFDDFKLIVKPVCISSLRTAYPTSTDTHKSTLISKICHAFRTQNKIDGDKEVYLLFDGDKLPSGGSIQETEISDMDTLDVIVK